MGQYSIAQRIMQQRQHQEPKHLIIAPYYIERTGEGAGKARIVLARDQVSENRISPGIYLVELRDGKKSIRFLREFSELEDKSEWYMRVPKDLSNAFENSQRIHVSFAEIDRNEFFEMVKGSVAERYALAGVEMKENRVSVELEKNRFEFRVSGYGYQHEYGYTGAYLTFEGPLPNDQSFKILYDGYAEPEFLLRQADGRYTTIRGISYDPELQHLHVKYEHGKFREHTRTIDVGEPAIEFGGVQELVERYFLAKSKRITSEMGATGTAIAAQLLKQIGYKVIWADRITGSTEGPDMSALDEQGNKVTVEVKSTSVPGAIDQRLKEAIEDVKDYYFNPSNPEKKFVWHSESGKLDFEADYALAVAIYLDNYDQTIDAKIRKIEATLSEEETALRMTPVVWRRQSDG